MTRILFLSHSSELRGAEKSLELLLRTMSKTLIEPIVAMPGKGQLFEMLSRLGITVYDVPLYWWIPPAAYPQESLLREYKQLPSRVSIIRDIIRKHGCQAVHTNSIVVAEGAFAASLERIPHIWHIREISDEQSGLAFPLGRTAMLGLVDSLSDRIVAVSKATAVQFDFSSHVEVVYNGVEIMPSPPAALPGKAESVKIAFAGNLIERKGVDLFIEACIGLENIDADYYIAGAFSDPGITERAINTVNASSKKDRFHFLDFRQDISSVLEACDIYVLASRNDPFPRTVIEAMAAGCAIVATDCGGASEAVRTCGAGEIVAVNAAGIRSGLQQLIQSPARLRKCRESARREVLEHFSAEKYASKMTEVLLNTPSRSKHGDFFDALVKDILSEKHVESGTSSKKWFSFRRER